MLALDADAVRDPPHCRMVEEQRLDDGLHQVDEEVVAADMRQLVREDHLHLFGGESGERGRGKKDDGTKPSDDGRHFDGSRFEKLHGPAKVERVREPARRALPFRRSVGRVAFRDRVSTQPSEKKAHGEQQNAHEPNEDDFRELGFGEGA